MPNITIATPDKDKAREIGIGLVARAEQLHIDSEEDHAEAQFLLQDIKAARTKVLEMFSKSKKLAHQTWRSLCETERRITEPCDQAKDLIMQKVIDYEAIERRRAREEAERKAEAARRIEEEATLRAAVAASEAGKDEEAENILDSLDHGPEPVVEPEPRISKVTGIHTVNRWSAEIVDKAALVKYVAENPQWLHLLEPNMKAINGLARSQRAALELPGVSAVCKSSKSIRA